MSTLQQTSNHDAYLDRWMTRGMGLIVNIFFICALITALTQDDGTLPQGWPVVICLSLCILSIFGAWRWERAGGLMAVFSAATLCLAVLYSTFANGLGWQGLVLALIYPLPYLVVGSLFLSDGQMARRAANRS
jgi:hypothetical protein